MERLRALPARRRLPAAASGAALLAIALAAARPPPAQALTWIRCANSPGFECASLAVPLERSGRVPGSLTLSVERRPAPGGQSASAVVALAGGPGQAALPLGEFIARAISPALTNRDLLVFDQRGTGSSDPLTCRALSSASGEAAGPALERCALEIGPARAGFTTRESVADIEALRRAAGYRRLVLYGTSYGTKAALEYASRYPSQVEALLLDSLVPPDGPDPFAVASFEAIGPVLGELCGAGKCAGVSSNPVGDLARLIAHLRSRPLRGVAFDGAGHRSRATLSEGDVLEVLQAGDLNPALRALLPGAVRSALAGDPGPIVRLHLLSEGLIPSLPREPVESSPPIDEALYATTSCEETPFPWQRSGAPAAKLAEALAVLHGLPPSDFFPFDSSTALANGLIGDCAWWPDASEAPPPPGPLPAVPTLILSGAQDLRTPTAQAARVAAEIPGAQLEVVPYTGHSVIGSDFSGCAQAAITAFFGGATVAPCTGAPDLFSPTPIPPLSVARLHPPSGLRGRPGQTLTAVLDTLVDLNRQVIGATLQADQELPSGSSFGGLRAGYARLTSSTATLRNYAFVPGVKLSGIFPVRNGQLQPATIRIAGSQASSGTVTFGLHRRVTGRLGGRRFDVGLASVHLSRVAAGEWPQRPTLFPLPALVGDSRRRPPGL